MRLRLAPKARERLDELPKNAQQRILDKLHWFSLQNDPLAFAEHVSGFNAYRFRIGMYRVFFEIDNNVLYILTIRKRDQAYKGLE